MANRGFISPPHRLLPGYSPLGGHRGGAVGPTSSRASPPDFSYDAFPRSASGGVAGGGGGARDSGPSYGSSRAPSSPASSALSLGYPGVAEFPYGLSGVQMPTYNFGSELYNYVSNGFPRKSRMCTFCNKVFTRSTTRRYHERRCPLLRASNSLAKSEENSAVAAAAALKEQQQKQQQQHQHRHKEALSGLPGSLPSPPTSSRGMNGLVHSSSRDREKDRDRDSGLIMNGGLGILGGRHTPPHLRHAPVPERSSTPPPASLHPAYPTTFPPAAAAAALGSSPSRAAAAAAAYSYAHTYGSHFYNSISAAALASLDQNSNKNRKEGRASDGSAPLPWSSSSLSPSSRPWEHPDSHHVSQQHHHGQGGQSQFPEPTSSSSALALGGRDGGELSGKSSIANSIMSSLGVDLTSRYCTDFSLRAQPPVFPTSQDNRGGGPVSPNALEPGETRSSSGRERQRSPSPAEDHASALVTPESGRQNGAGWSSPMSAGSEKREEDRFPHHSHYGMGFQDKIPTSNISGARLKSTSSEDNAIKSPKEQPRFMAVRPLDDDEEEEEEDEEDEEEMEEDEEQFNEAGSAGSREDSLMVNTGTPTLDVSALGSGRTHGAAHARNSAYNPLVCNICKKSFSDTIARQAHEALHSQTKLFACAICSRSFHCAYSLRIHFLRHHSSGGPYSCKYCPEKYGGALDLKAHLVTQHALPKQEACSLKYFSLLEEPTGSPRSSLSGGAASTSSQRSALSDSERDSKIHENGRLRGRVSPSQRRSAESLPGVLSTPEDYDTTKTIHERIRQRTSDSATNEKSCHIEENGKIREQGRSSSRVLPVTNGELSSSKSRGASGAAEKEEETEVCKVCNKAFAKSFIRFHERAHADQKPYECSICHKRFGYKNNMKSHMKLHQGLKPYQCQICGARFTRGSTLRRHGRRHNISRNSMLEYVLYDHSAGPTRAVGVTSKTGNASVTPTAAAAAASQHAVAVASSLYAQQMATRISPSEQNGISTGGSTSQMGFSPGLSRQNSGGGDPYVQSAAMARRTPPPRTSPQSLTSPRTPSNTHLTTQAMAGPMVGGLAAVAAANLFGYPAAAAPHLYQLYASANPLMSYPHGYASAPHPHHATQAAAAVQSDALNLSLGKRKSPFQDEEQASDPPEKTSRRSSDSGGGGAVDASNGGSFKSDNAESLTDTAALARSADVIKVETEEPVEPNEASSNPFTPVYSPKTDASPIKKEDKHHRFNNEHRDQHHHHHHHHDHHQHHHHRSHQHHNHSRDSTHSRGHSKHAGDGKEELKISTEDFAAQVNFCCPSPLVQSSTGHAHIHRSSSATGSPPVGSTSSPTSPPANSTTTAAGSTTENVTARASPSGHVSHPTSPDNTTTTTTTSPIPSPTAENEAGLVSGAITIDGENGEGPEDGKLNHKKGLNNPLHELLLSLIASGRMFRCSYCEIYFTEYAMFRLHQKYHQCDLDRPFVCSVCGEDCKDKTYFTVHLSEHLGLGTKQALA